MKKLVCLFLIVVLTTSALFGCSSSSKFSKDDLTVINTETKEEISIGMSRAEIEEKIGLPDSVSLGYNDYEDLSICYYENEAVYFVLRNLPEGKSYWKTKRGISAKSSVKEITEAYGASFEEDDYEKSLVLYFDENFKLYDEEEFRKNHNIDDYATADELMKELNNAQKYGISFHIGDGRSMIYIGYIENMRLSKYDM